MEVQTIPQAPEAAAVPYAVEIHDAKIPDEYAWLRHRDNPAVLEYLQKENEYTEAVMASTAPLKDALFEEMKTRTPQTDCSAPVKNGPFAYYSRTVEGKDYRIRCRGPRDRAPDSATEQVLLDGNLLAEGKDYFEIGAYELSPDQRVLAYSTDFDGAEKFELRVRDLSTGFDLPDRIEDTYYAVEWSACGQFLFYSTLDEAMRPYRVWRHRLGTNAAEDVLVCQEDDQAFHLEIGKTRSERFLLLESSSLTTSETRLLDATQPEGEFQLVLPRRPMVEYSVEPQGDWLWMLINDTGRNFRLVRMPFAGNWADPAEWVEVIAHRDEVCLEGADAFSRFLVISERERGLPQILVMETTSGEQHRVAFPEAVYAASIGANPEFESQTLRLAYESPVSPPADIDYDMLTRQWTVVRQQQVMGGFHPEDYQVDRLTVPTADGVFVPLSVVSRKGLPRDGSAPALLYGYGAYGLTIEAGFSPERLSLLERDFVFAIAHVRGGGDLGETWHDKGKMEQKPNSFHDFVACAEALVAHGYTSSARLGILGRSAGGLLVTASMNLRPDLFGAVVASVPFVDVLNTMLDASLPLTVGEYEEWGNPRDPRFFEIIRGYSPYDNLRPAQHPHLLVTAGLHDPRVSYWEPAKFVARLRRLAAGNQLLLLKTELGAGHFGPSGRYDAWKETAFEYAFLIRTLAPELVSAS
ncbi:MAG: S9 family peptidase [Bryobacterales bacterium]|nr:S9 family peptidase [Bryobacterales bacterium]